MGQLFASVSKGSPLEHVKVEIGENKVKISRHDMVYEDILATKVYTKQYIICSVYMHNRFLPLNLHYRLYSSYILSAKLQL